MGRGAAGGKLRPCRRATISGRHMRFLSTESGHRLDRLKPRFAAFAIRFRGENILVVHQDGDNALVRALSNLTFPRHGVPSKVIRWLRDQNAELARCSYEVIDGEDGSFICVSCQIPLGKLTVAAFEAAGGGHGPAHDGPRRGAGGARVCALSAWHPAGSVPAGLSTSELFPPTQRGEPWRPWAPLSLSRSWSYCSFCFTGVSVRSTRPSAFKRTGHDTAPIRATDRRCLFGERALVWNLLPELAKLPCADGFERLADYFRTAFSAYFDGLEGWALPGTGLDSSTQCQLKEPPMEVYVSITEATADALALAAVLLPCASQRRVS